MPQKARPKTVAERRLAQPIPTTAAQKAAVKVRARRVLEEQGTDFAVRTARLAQHEHELEMGQSSFNLQDVAEDRARVKTQEKQIAAANEALGNR